MSEIRYGKAALPVCCSAIANRLEQPYGEAFQEVCRTYDTGENQSFCAIFVERMEQELGRLPLKQEDCQSFLAPFQRKGFQDEQMQLKSLEQSILRLRTCEERLSQEIAQKSRMSVGLGVMSGLLLVVIMV